MGLDCYVMVKENEGTEVPGESARELWYARKLNEVHGWMQRASGIPAEDFNCEPFYLTEEVLAAFEKDWQEGKLSSTSGLFFGGRNSLDDINESVVLLLIESRKALAEGLKPYYYSWW